MPFGLAESSQSTALRIPPVPRAFALAIVASESCLRIAGLGGSRSTPSYLITSPVMLDARTAALIADFAVPAEELDEPDDPDVAAGVGVGVTASVDGLVAANAVVATEETTSTLATIPTRSFFFHLCYAS